MDRFVKKAVAVFLAVVMLLSISSFSELKLLIGSFSAAAANFYVLKNVKGTIADLESVEYSFSAPESTNYTLKYDETENYYDARRITVVSSLNEEIFNSESFQVSEQYRFFLNKGEYRLIITECDDTSSEYTLNMYYSKAVHTNKITLSNNDILLSKGATYSINALVNPANSDDRIKYKSENPDVAVANANGIITARSVGTTNILVTSGSVTEKCRVTVRKSVKKTKIFETQKPIWITEDDQRFEYKLSVPATGKVIITLKSYDDYLDYLIEVRDSSGRIVRKYDDEELERDDSKNYVVQLTKGNYTIVTKMYYCMDDRYMLSASLIPCVKVPTKKITLNKSKITTSTQKNIQLTTVASPSYGTEAVKWKSSNPYVADVTQTGIVNTNAFGKATITATSGSKSAKCTVIVNNGGTVALEQGLVASCSGYVVGIPKYKRGTWSSSDKSVARVDKGGNVTVRSSGTAKITYKAPDGDKYSFKVKVVPVKPDMAALLYSYNTHDNYFVVTFKNNSKWHTVTILNGTTKVEDYDYKEFDRSVYLSKSYTIEPGKTKKIKFKVKGSVTWWDYSDFTLYYKFKYNGRTYNAKTDCFSTSKYIDGKKWVNTYQNKKWFSEWRMRATPDL